MRTPTIRPAGREDVPAMVALSERKRAEAETHQPVFWRKAADSAVRQAAFFAALLKRPNVIALVAEGSPLAGFVVATLAPAPPVYDPGGLTCLIDDFCVEPPSRWGEVGEALLRAVGARARERGAVQAVVVCGLHQSLKRELLSRLRLSVASEWYVGPLPT